MKNRHIGEGFETAFEPDEVDEMRALAQKEIITEGLRQAMVAQHVSESELARRMKTSRTSVRRVLDPHFAGSKFDLIAQASAILGKQLTLVDHASVAGRGPARRGTSESGRKKGPKMALAPTVQQKRVGRKPRAVAS
jgi:antitoxin HicB